MVIQRCRSLQMLKSALRLLLLLFFFFFKKREWMNEWLGELKQYGCDYFKYCTIPFSCPPSKLRTFFHCCKARKSHRTPKTSLIITFPFGLYHSVCVYSSKYKTNSLICKRKSKVLHFTSITQIAGQNGSPISKAYTYIFEREWILLRMYGIPSFVATFIHVPTCHSIVYPLFRFVSFCSLLTRFDHFDNFWAVMMVVGCRLILIY